MSSEPWASNLCTLFFQEAFQAFCADHLADYMSDTVFWRGDTELLCAQGKRSTLQLVQQAINFYKPAHHVTDMVFTEHDVLPDVKLVDGTIMMLENGSTSKTFRTEVVCALQGSRAVICSVQYHQVKLTGVNTTERILNALYDAMPFGVLSYDYRDGILTPFYFNHEFPKQLGLTPEALQAVLAEDSFGYVSMEDHEPLQNALRTVSESRGATKAECRVKIDKPHGTQWFQIQAHAFHWIDRRMFIVTSMVDITREVDAQEQIKTVIDNIPASLCALEMIDGTIYHTLLSSDFPKMMGYSANDFFHHDIADDFRIVHPDDLFIVENGYQQARNGQEHIDMTFRMRNHDGRYIWTNLVVQRYPLPTKNPTYFGVYFDVDAKIHALAELAAAKNELENVITSLPGGIAIFRYVGSKFEPGYCSNRLCELPGVDREAYLQAITDANPFGYLGCDQLNEAIEQCLIFGKPQSQKQICKLIKDDDTALWVGIVFSIVDSIEGTSLFMLVTDISEEMRLRQIEQWQSERYRIISEVSEATIFDYDPARDAITYHICTQQHTTDDTTSMYFSDRIMNSSLFHPDDRAQIRALFDTAVQTPISGTMELRTQLLETGYRWYQLHYISLADATGKVIRALGRLDDIQSGKEKELRDRASLQRETLFRRATSPETLFAKEFNLSTGEWIPSETDVFLEGLEKEASFQRTLIALCGLYIHSDDRVAVLNMLDYKHANQSDARQTVHDTIACRMISHTSPCGYRWARLDVTVINNEEIQQVFGFIVLTDIHEQKLQEIQNWEQANLDMLTLLPNRMNFERTVAEKLSDPAAQHAMDAVVYIDIDAMGKVNDLLGYDAGNQWLQQTGHTIRALARENELICRYGSDEFAMVLADIPDDSVLQERLRILCAALYRRLNDETVISVSIGCAKFMQDQATDASLFENAARALYFSKVSGGNQYSIHTPELDAIVKNIRATQAAKSAPDMPSVYVRTFGHFDVFINDNAMFFNNPKAKELLALLIDRKGGFVSAGDAIGCLWEDKPADRAMLAKYRKTALQLNVILEKYGISYIVENNNGMRRVVPHRLECDYYRFLDGSPTLLQEYAGMYMVDYSWAEETIAMLDSRRNA